MAQRKNEKVEGLLFLVGVPIVIWLGPDVPVGDDRKVSVDLKPIKKGLMPGQGN